MLKKVIYESIFLRFFQYKYRIHRKLLIQFLNNFFIYCQANIMILAVYIFRFVKYKN